MPPKPARLSRTAHGCNSAAPEGWPGLAYARDDAASAEQPQSAAARILIVEDDFFISMQMEVALTEAGFEVVGIAASSEEAIRLARSHAPRLVLMDIRLAGKRDGVDTAIELFETLGIRSIFTTAHDNPRVRTRAAPAAPIGWLAKPYTMNSLIEVVRKAVAELNRQT